ncbi:MAG: aminoacyl-tRNA hydrolase [Candidatus Tectomicrobia bacterium]
MPPAGGCPSFATLAPPSTQRRPAKAARSKAWQGNARSENRKFKRHFIALPSGEQPRKTPLGPFSVTRRRPLLARSAGGSPGTPRRPTTAPRSKVSHGNTRSGQADQDALGWRLRDFLVRGLRNGRFPESWGGGHNGLQDLIDPLRTSDFPRLRVGIGNDFARGQQVGYVLSPFTEAEQPLAQEAITQATDAVLTFLQEGIDIAMDRYNRRA